MALVNHATEGTDMRDWRGQWIDSKDLKRVAHLLDVTTDLRDRTSSGRRAPGAYAMNAARKAGASDTEFLNALTTLGIRDLAACIER